MKELKPCPFCGGEAVIRVKMGNEYICPIHKRGCVIKPELGFNRVCRLRSKSRRGTGGLTMREILFRGKRIDNGEWVEGYYYKAKYYRTDDELCDYITVPHPKEYNEPSSHYIVNPDTVGQYTGLKDKNGTKIFEGDIFKFNDEVWESYYTSCGTEYDSCEVKNYGVVGFDEDRSCFDFVQYKFNENSVEADLHENHDIEFADFISELEVIGNIHDNPELLEGGDGNA